MNIFINGFKPKLRSHVVLNQPTSFTEAEKLARLREAVTSTSEENSVTASSPTVHEQRIKELKGQVKLLLSLASNQTSSKLPSLNSITSDVPRNLLHDVPPPLESQGDYLAIGSRSEIHQVKADIIAAIQNSAQNNVRPSQNRFQPNYRNSGESRGRNLRTTDGQPICNLCQRVGRVARYCQQRYNDYEALRAQQLQPRFRQTPSRSQEQYLNQQDLNGKGPSNWEKLRALCFGNASRFNENTNSQGRAETPATMGSTKIGQSYSKVEPVADVDSKAQNIPPIGSYSANKTTFSNVAVCGCILSQSVRLLVGTGAAISVVSEQFYKVTLRSNFQLKKNNSISNIKTSDGKTTPVIGFVSFEIIIGDHSYNCDASVVPNPAYQVVLGCDFLHANNAIIDVKREPMTRG